MIKRIVGHVTRIKATSFELAGKLMIISLKMCLGLSTVSVCTYLFDILSATLSSSSPMLSWLVRSVAKTIGQAKDF